MGSEGLFLFNGDCGTLFHWIWGKDRENIRIRWTRRFDTFMKEGNVEGFRYESQKSKWEQVKPINLRKSEGGTFVDATHPKKERRKNMKMLF